MLRLILLRHGAAEPAAIDGNDFDRPLTRAGRDEATAAGRRIAAAGPAPQLVLTSPAVRALATAELAAGAAAVDAARIRQDAALYPGAAATLKTAIERGAGGVQCLLVVGHNPALSDLASRLDPAGARVALATGAFHCLDLALEDWRLP